MDAPAPIARPSLGALLMCSLVWCLAPHPVWAAQAFEEDSGQVVIEAEHYDMKVPRNGKDWVAAGTAGFSGSGSLKAMPNTGTNQNTSYLTNSPELVYHVSFKTTGTYSVWVRGYGATANDDSLHAGIDGTGPSSADRITPFTASWTWNRNTADGSPPAPATVTVATPGVHTIHLWMREDGFEIDKLLLTTSTSATPPSGMGPAESPRVTLSDTTAPSTTGQPKEGSSSDLDYDSDGSYTIYWTLASDLDSGITAYELQERTGGVAGTWTSLTTTATSGSFAVTGRLHNIRYTYQVRAQNGVGLWSGWSVESDGILVDTTAPSPVTVTDDGATTSSTTTLHATWTASSDAESGLSNYDYRILRDSTSGTQVVGWTSTSLNTQVTRTGLTLVNGVTYYVAVRAKNRAGTYSSVAYSDGITVSTAADTTPPVLSSLSATGVTTNSVTIGWTTNEPATSQVEYGPTTAYGQLTPLDATLVTTHSTPLTGLTFATLYHFRVRSRDAAGNEALSPDQTVTTATPPDTTPPTGSITINSGAVATNNPAVALTLAATDNAGPVAQMCFSGDGVTFPDCFPYATTQPWTLTSGDGAKTVSVKFSDAAGNWSTPVSDTIELDTTPPVLEFLSPQDGEVIPAP